MRRVCSTRRRSTETNVIPKFERTGGGKFLITALRGFEPALPRPIYRLTQAPAHLVVMHLFGGMTKQEVAYCLDISENTLERQWRSARSWLQRALSDQE